LYRPENVLFRTSVSPGYDGNNVNFGNIVRSILVFSSIACPFSRYATNIHTREYSLPRPHLLAVLKEIVSCKMLVRRLK
jgi:hypothetical protein